MPRQLNVHVMHSIALYSFSVFARFLTMAYKNGLGLSRAHVQHATHNTLKITISAPRRIKWRPGQHFFVNFLCHRPIQSHPFTIASICAAKDDGRHELVVFLRQGLGMTETLNNLVTRVGVNGSPVLLDGPYGGGFSFRTQRAPISTGLHLI